MRRPLPHNLIAIISLVLFFVLSPCSHSASAADDNYLNVSLLTCPPKYLGGIYSSQRTRLLLLFSSQWSNDFLDYIHGRFTYESDNPYEDVRFGVRTGVWVKVLPRGGQYPENPLIFVHLGELSPSSKNQTFILNGDEGGWFDVTSKYFPKPLAKNMALIPTKTGDDIQVAGYQKSNSGNYDFGPVRLLLHWNGKSFEEHPVKARPLIAY